MILVAWTAFDAESGAIGRVGAKARDARPIPPTSQSRFRATGIRNGTKNWNRNTVPHVPLRMPSISDRSISAHLTGSPKRVKKKDGHFFP